MQRLFSMFPAGWPGLALLMVRVALGLMVMEGVSGPLLSLGSAWLLLAPSLVAIALGIGFLTPVIGSICVVLEVVVHIAAGGAIGAVHVCAVLNAVAISLLGPGAYSVDARVFGRRRIVLPPRPDDDNR